MTVQKSKSQQLIGLLAWLALLFVVAAVGSLGSLNAPNFYAELAVPSWAPPGWLFGPRVDNPVYHDGDCKLVSLA